MRREWKHKSNMGDVDHLQRRGVWPAGKVPDWAQERADHLHTFPVASAIIECAYRDEIERLTARVAELEQTSGTRCAYFATEKDDGVRSALVTVEVGLRTNDPLVCMRECLILLGEWFDAEDVEWCSVVTSHRTYSSVWVSNSVPQAPLLADLLLAITSKHTKQDKYEGQADHESAGWQPNGKGEAR